VTMQRAADKDNGETFLDLLVTALNREESELATLRCGQPERKPPSVCHMGEAYLHNLLRKEAMRRPGGSHVDWPYLEWELSYKSGGSCDICFVHYLGGVAVPYAAFEIKGPWDACRTLTQQMRAKVRADIVKHSGKQLRGTTNPVERYGVIMAFGTEQEIDTWMQSLDPDLQNEGVAPQRRWSKPIPMIAEDRAPTPVLRAEVLKYASR
jgi:hypothetical protein